MWTMRTARDPATTPRVESGMLRRPHLMSAIALAVALAAGG